MDALPTILSTLCLGIVGWIAKKIHDIVKRFVVLEQSQQDQLKAAIVDKYETATERGYITPLSLDIVNKFAESYFKRGGNSYIKSLMKHMNEDMEIKGRPIPKD